MVPAGLAVALAAAACYETAYVLQAREARHGDAGRTPAGLLGFLLRRRRWLLGTALAGAGAVLQVLALRLAPITVVQPALALGIVGLVVVGGWALGEPATRADVAAGVCLAAGVALLAVAGGSVESKPVSGLAAAIAFVALGGLLAFAFLRPRAAPGWLVLGAAAGDAMAALAAARLADALFAAVALAWLAFAGLAVAGSLATEMSALRLWPATRVGPFVLVGQTAIPVLLAPLVIGEDWTSRAPLVAAGLALTALGAWRLAASAGLLERREAVQEHVGRGGQREP